MAKGEFGNKRGGAGDVPVQYDMIQDARYGTVR